ncbi:MAG: hypothetical protein M1821_001598 [Bathelium mastoideum]|nr:MAG: hypothetical protein M1821_001598 [Bathelium mastoideum]KAI9691485.1 MAG: hypothetical protein M1822_007556 [Bathelium mastoideum]
MPEANGFPSPTSTFSTTNTHSSSPSPSISWPLNRPSSPGPWSPRVDHALRAREASTIVFGSSTALHTSFSPSAASQAQLDPDLLPSHRKSLSSISLQAFCLGCGFAVGVLLSLELCFGLLDRTGDEDPNGKSSNGGRGRNGGNLWAWWRVPTFLAVLATFHFLEFWTTARYNTPRADASSFLLFNNGAGYFLAQVCAFGETCAVAGLANIPSRAVAGSVGVPYTYLHTRIVVTLGFVLVVLGQVVRSTAMAHLGTNFHHIVQVRRNEGHELVTSGIYAVLRHPSYFGFFWWAVGTQLVLGNCICLIAYFGVLWRFFGHRIQKEEKALLEFFGDEYANYKAKTIVGIPFVS